MVYFRQIREGLFLNNLEEEEKDEEI